MSRLIQINQLLQKKLAILISREIPLKAGMITITRVETSPDLKYSKIFISVMPPKLSGSALKNLRKNNAIFSQEITKTSRLRKIPKFKWLIDEVEKGAFDIYDTLQRAEKGGEIEEEFFDTESS